MITLPSIPPVALKPVVETRIWTGCLAAGAAEAPWLPAPEEERQELVRFLQVAAGKAPPAGGGCTPYALAFADANDVRSVAVLQGGDRERQPANVAMMTTRGGQATVTAGRLDLALVLERRRERVLPASEPEAWPEEALADLAPHLRWQLDILARQVAAIHGLAPAHHFRLLLGRGAEGEAEHIAAFELVESATGLRVEGVYWLERPDAPGAFISSSGTDMERAFWTAPVKETRVSRGVGPSVLAMRRRVAVKAAGQQKPRYVTRTFRYGGTHIGVDFAAPKGTPVLAVADAVVSFIGTRGGFGKLVVLEHGQDHQTYYAHLSAFADDLRVGGRIARGELVGRVGATGFATGPHLHYEIRKEGRFMDPFLASSRLECWSLGEDEHFHLLSHAMVLDATRAWGAPPAAAP